MISVKGSQFFARRHGSLLLRAVPILSPYPQSGGLGPGNGEADGDRPLVHVTPALFS